MVLGAIWCPQDKLKEINQRIRQIKARNQIPSHMEAKWTKISPAKIDFYKDLVNYFFDDDDLHFRAVIIPDKRKLNHEAFHQTHDTWYYKMYFDLLKVIFIPTAQYEVYIDIKDSNSHSKSQHLKDICNHSMLDFSGKNIRRIQPVRSDEIEIMQMVDILIGAIGYENRDFPAGFNKSTAKKQIVDLIKQRSGYTLSKTTLLREEKVNLLYWNAREQYE